MKKIGVNSKKQRADCIEYGFFALRFDISAELCQRVSDKNVTSKNNAICVVVVFKIVENIQIPKTVWFEIIRFFFFFCFNTLIVMAISWKCCGL